MTDKMTKTVSSGNLPDIDPDKIRELAKLLEETGLSEVEIEGGGVRLRVARGTSVTMAPTAPGSAMQAAAMPLEPARKQGTVVTSPMVGTVYLSAQPGAPAFVKVGDKVSDGTLCIIEAMKTMNPVPSPVAGKIVEIYVHDGQPVEFGEPLMLID